MKFYLKILNEVRHQTVLKVDGSSGMRYVFNWNAKDRCYEYAPKSQQEVDDLFRTMGRTTSYIFAPVERAGKDVAAEPVKTNDKAPATLKPALTEQCLVRGLIVSEDDSNETAERLISAYDKGAADTLARHSAPKKRTRTDGA